LQRLVQALDLSETEVADLRALRDRRAATNVTRTRRQPPSNLPTPVTGFVGRERELAEIQQLLDTRRLLTLVGPGGVGKSRLTLEAAWSRLERYTDGVWLVDLAPLPDAALLLRTVASVLGVIEGPRRSLEAALAWLLRERDLLLVVDNCEHLLGPAASLVERLLRNSPRLRVIATSREPLDVSGEQLYDVSPLAVPAEGERDPARLQASEAARFFTDRARLTQPRFALTEDVAEAVTTICRRLDGIPLALELAAARLRTLSVAEIAPRLDDRFSLLTSARQGAERRHRTLREMVDWSWDLLSEPERVLLRRLAVFAGGWTREAAEEVTGSRLQGLDLGDIMHEPSSIAETLASLVERSLVVCDDWRGSRRYRLLDTIRGYAEERLRESDEEPALRRAHQQWCIRLLEESTAEMSGDQLAWLRMMDAELENIRAALDWCRAEPNTAELALQASFGIWIYWDTRGHGDEARQRLEELLTLLPKGPPTRGGVIGRCFYLHVLGSMGVLTPVIPLLEETRELAHRLDDRAASFWFRWIELQYFAASGDPGGPAAARAALAEQRAAPMPLGDTFVPWYCGLILLGSGELEEAECLLRQTLETAVLNHVRDLAMDFLGMVLFRRGDIEAAQRHFQQALAGSARFQDLRPCAVTLEHLADVAGRLGRWGRAARLQGASEMLMDRSNKIRLPFWQLEPASTADACRAALGEDAFAAAFAAGRAMTPEQAIEYALEEAL
jgi:non-specific serine/threonine protein kinase